MKFERMVKQEVEVTHLHAVMCVRHWEDASVNGADEDNDAPTIPFAIGETWKITVDLATGRISDWPEGTTASTDYKVCDAGCYMLIDADGKVVASKDDYVPKMLCPKDNGFGDYVIMDIASDGTIQGWKADLSYFTD